MSDGKTLIYSPTPLLVEAGSKQPNSPNGIILESTPPAIAREVGATPLGAETRTIGLDPVPAAKVEKVQNDLKQNPPLQFDIARTLRVFNWELELWNLSGRLFCLPSHRSHSG